MKTLAILGAVVAITLASAANAASKPQRHDAGGPMKQGQYCWVATTAEGAGYWERCEHARRDSEDTVHQQGDGGGGGGNN